MTLRPTSKVFVTAQQHELRTSEIGECDRGSLNLSNARTGQTGQAD